MLEDPGPPSFARRMFAALARFGIDLRPPLRRARHAILRPARHELAVETAALRKQFATQIAAISARLEAEVRKRQTLEARLFEISLWLDSEAASRRAFEARVSEVAARLDAERKERRSRLGLIESLMTETYRPPAPRIAQRLSNIPSPIVSVILPTRDRARFVGEAIASVQAQTFGDWELIAVDDGSKDDTPAAVEPFLDDRRVRYVRQPAQGASAARNHALKLARGAFIAYLDSDNFWYPDFLKFAVNELAADPNVNLVYGALVIDSPHLDGTRLLWMPFDRALLMTANYIDMSVVVHRKSMIERYGAFDESLARVNDWDLVLRYTEHIPARPLPVLAARYRVVDEIRISSTLPLGPEVFKMKRKSYPPAPGRRPRVLYALWHYPQLSETYVETELRCMRRWGVHVEVWRETAPASPYPAAVPIHDGALTEAVRRVQPDIVHVHWLNFAAAQQATLSALGVPVTIRLHGFEVTPEALRATLGQSWVRAIYGFSHHLREVDQPNPRLMAVPAPFDTSLFRPSEQKDRRLVLRAGAALPSKDLTSFLELAERLPDHRFVLAAITCSGVESFVEELKNIHRSMNSPAELMFDLPRQDIVPLMERAGIYVHTARLPGAEHATPIGMPVSIAEAMATGAYVLVRDIPELRAYVGDAGTAYRDAEHAAQIIASTGEWSEQKWKTAWMTSVDRAFSTHADEIALRPIFEDWCSAVERGDNRQ